MKVIEKRLPGGKIVYKEITVENAQEIIDSRNMYLKGFKDVLTPGELQQTYLDIKIAKHILTDLNR